jgi:hypothetical protein
MDTKLTFSRAVFGRVNGRFQAANPVYNPSRKNEMAFMVRHYAGEVDYDGEGFLEKNRDTLNADLLELLEKSTLPLLIELYPPSTVMSALDRKATLGKQVGDVAVSHGSTAVACMTHHRSHPYDSSPPHPYDSSPLRAAHHCASSSMISVPKRHRFGLIR